MALLGVVVPPPGSQPDYAGSTPVSASRLPTREVSRILTCSRSEQEMASQRPAVAQRLVRGWAIYNREAGLKVGHLFREQGIR